jgi:4,5-DOPA dioxygenase extradiol
MEKPMPAIFFGHGNPMNALGGNDFTDAWTACSAAISKPRAVLSVSAHWYVAGTFVTAMAAPRTIHDFGGFPAELYQIEYPAPGEPELAGRVAELLAPLRVGQDQKWGLDHGTWSVLCHLFPEADVPIVQLSIDRTKETAFHYNIAQKLAALRDEGVLIIGSGNLVHNLQAYSWGSNPVKSLDWGVRFEDLVRAHLATGDHQPLIDYQSMGQDALLAVPTPDHYLPLLYVIALQREAEPVGFPVEGFDGGSVSMLAVRVG